MDAANVDARIVDAAPDGPTPLGNFGTPMKIPGLSLSTAVEDDVTLNSTETELIFAINLNNEKNLYVSTRANQQAAWSAPTALTVLNGAGNDSAARLSADGLTLYFSTVRNGASEDIWMSQRANLTAPWAAPTAMATVNSTSIDRWFMPCGGKYIMGSDRTVAGDIDLYEGTMGQAPSRLQLSTTGGVDTAPFLTTDCLTLYWAKDNGGQLDIFVATRPTMADPWTVVGAVPIVSTAGREEDPWLSADGRRLYLASSVDTELDLYVATR